MYVLDNPNYLWLLALLPFVALLFWWSRNWSKKARRHFGDPQLLERLYPNRSKTKPALKLLVALLAMAFLCFGLVNPKMGSRLETVKREGIEIVFALDLSNSMYVEDARPNRLEKAKLIISRTLDQLIADRVALVNYAASSLIQMPMTTDYGAARMYLKSASPEQMPVQGTDFQEAIKRSLAAFDPESKRKKLIVVVSDGEDHEGNYAEVMQSAQELGVRIITIGVGSERGGPVPQVVDGKAVDFKRNSQGEVVVSQLNPAILSEIAGATDGKYIGGSSVRATVEALMDEVETMEKQEFESQVFADYEDQFQWFLAAAFFLLALDVLILNRKTQWFMKLNLFKNDGRES